MTSCCSAGAYEQMFNPRMARRSLRRYRKKGLDRLERLMLASAVAGELEGKRVLEIGGGIGTIQSELLQAGAGRGEIVELSPAWEPYALELARERGHAERTNFRVADVLADPTALDPADVVVLNRVVCCSPEGVRLTGIAARTTRQTLVLSFPRDRFLMRTGLRLVNTCLWLMRRSFRVFFHEPVALAAAAEAEGLRPAAKGRGAFWQFATFRRAT